MTANMWDFELLGPLFQAKYRSSCYFDFTHTIKVGDPISRINRLHLPLVPVPGVACKNCTKLLGA